MFKILSLINKIGNENRKIHAIKNEIKICQLMDKNNNENIKYKKRYK
jgi:hypothetical protein